MNGLDPLMERLSRFDPVDTSELAGMSRSALAERLLADVMRERPRFVVHRRRQLVPILAVAATVVVILIGSVIVPPGNEAPATASQLLLQTSAIAAGGEAPTTDGTFAYRKVAAEQLSTDARGPEPWSVVLPVVEEQWTADDGAGRIRTVFGSPRFLGPRDRARWRAGGSPEFPSGVSDTTFPVGALPTEELGALPTDPAVLLRELRKAMPAGGVPLDIAVFVRVGDLLANGDASPELRAALYRVAARLSGIELLGDVMDPQGRPGVAVSLMYDDTGAAVQAVMIFDPETSELLAQEQILLEPASWVDAGPGTRLSYTAYVEQGRTDSVENAPVSTV